MTTHLIIPDGHIKPDQSHHRVEALANFIADYQPDNIINIGDWYDLPSLSHYDIGTASYEGRRYSKDIDAGRGALEYLTNCIAQVPSYRPQLDLFIGNHENRIAKIIDTDPRLIGTVGLGDLGAAELGWRVNPFLQPRVIDGIAYCHYFVSGVLSRAISGVNIGARLLTMQNMSCIQGHNHTFDYSERPKADGGKVMGMTVGCYFTHREEWARAANQLYWRGLVLVTDVSRGYGEIKKYGIGEVGEYA